MTTYDKILDKAFVLGKKINGDLESDIDLLMEYVKVNYEFIDYIYTQEAIGRKINNEYSNIGNELKKVNTYFKNKYNFDLVAYDTESIEKYVKILKRELKINNLTDDN